MYPPNEIPVELEEAFSPEFILPVRAYIESLQRAIDECDLVVLVARKAVCLYYAFCANGELENRKHSAKVVSSRVLDYSIARHLPHSRVAVYDDIMVHGGSASQTMERVQLLGWNAEINVIGLCSRELGSDVKRYPLRYAEDLALADVYRLAREIVRYVQASGISNNIDQPLYHIEDSDHALRRAIGDGIWFDLTTTIQRKYNIENISAVFEEPVRPTLIKGPVDPLSVLLRRSVSKVRLFYNGDNRSTTVIPFVLPPGMSQGEIERLFSLIVINGGKPLFSAEGEADDACALGANTRLRVIRYVTSKLLAEALLSDERIRQDFGDCRAHYDEDVETMLFGASIEQLIRHDECSALDWNLDAAEVPVYLPGYLEPAVKLAQVSLLKAERRMNVWPVKGRLDGDDCRDAAIGIADLVEKTARVLGTHTDEPLALNDEECVILASAALDALIDEGRFIPSAQAQKDSGILKACRLYRGGEIFTPTRKKLLQTAVVLGGFSAALKKENPPKRVHDETANLVAALFMRWNDPKIGASTNEAGAFADELVWSSNAGALCGSDGMTLVDILRDLRLLNGQYEAISLEGDVLSPEELANASDFASDMGSLFSYSRAGGRQDQAVQQNCGNKSAMVYALEKMLYTHASGFKVSYAHAAFSRIARRLGIAADNQDWTSIIQGVDGSMFIEEPQEALVGLSKYCEKAGIRPSSFWEYCKDRGSGAPAHSDLLLALCRQTYETLSKWAEGGVNVSPGERRRCIDTVEMLPVILSEICRSGGSDALREVQGIAYDDTEVASIPTESLSEWSGAKSRDRTILASRVLNRAFREDARVVCFVDDALRVVAVSRLASMENGHLDTACVYPRRLVCALEDWVKENAAPRPRCASLILCAADADVGEVVARGVIDSAGLSYCGVIPRGDATSTWICDLEGYLVAAYHVKKGATMVQGTVWNQCNFMGAFKPEIKEGSAFSLIGDSTASGSVVKCRAAAGELPVEAERRLSELLQMLDAQHMELEASMRKELEKIHGEIIDKAGEGDKGFLKRSIETLESLNNLLDSQKPVGKGIRAIATMAVSMISAMCEQLPPAS